MCMALSVWSLKQCWTGETDFEDMHSTRKSVKTCRMYVATYACVLQQITQQTRIVY